MLFTDTIITSQVYYLSGTNHMCAAKIQYLVLHVFRITRYLF